MADCARSRCLPAPAADYLQVSFWDGEPSPPSSASPTASESSAPAVRTWPTPTAGDAKSSGSRIGNPNTKAHPGVSLTDAVVRSRCSTTSERSTLPDGEDGSTSSRAGSRASHSPTPDRVVGAMTSATCGPIPCAFWSTQERLWGSSRTSLDSSACIGATTLERFSADWPMQGSMRSGVVWERTTSAPHTGASASGFSPTSPTSDCAPAPAATSGSSEEDGGTATRRTWGTPQAGDWKGAATTREEDSRGQLRHQVKGRLNPLWVDWLMGWPIGWETTDPLPASTFAAWRKAFLTVLLDCAPWATDRCLSSPPPRSGSSRDARASSPMADAALVV